MCYFLRVVIALTQWKSEIEKFCERNALSICTYHGSDRVKNTPRALLTTMYDIVLTTYQVLEADFRKMVSPNKVKVSYFHLSLNLERRSVG
jgi:DNA repair protein RAD16